MATKKEAANEQRRPPMDQAQLRTADPQREAEKIIAQARARGRQNSG